MSHASSYSLQPASVKKKADSEETTFRSPTAFVYQSSFGYHVLPITIHVLPNHHVFLSINF